MQGSTRLYLHIGAHKTGSTSIQHSFYRSADALKRHGLSYFPYAENHSNAMVWLFSERRDRFHVTVKQRLSAAEVQSRQEEVAQNLKAFLSAPSGNKVISGEEISLLTEPEVVRLREFLRQSGIKDIKVIMYVRNYYDYLNSTIPELIKGGNTLEWVERSLKEGKPAALPRYQFRIEKFIQTFGRQHVDVRLFDNALFEGGDLIADFCHAVGAPSLKDDVTVVRANASICMDSVQLLSRYNKLFPLNTATGYNPKRSEKARLYFSGSSGPKFRVESPELLQAYDGATADDRTYVEQVVGSEFASRLTARKERDDASGNKRAHPGSEKAAADLNVDYLFRSVGRALLDVESYENALKIAIEGLGGEAEKGPRAASIRQSFKFIHDDTLCRRLARAYMGAGKLDAAAIAAERALELAGNSENSRLLADLYCLEQKWAKATRAYSAVAELDQTNAIVFRRLSTCLAKMGKLEESVHAARKATELSPSNDEYRRHLASVTSRATRAQALPDAKAE